MWHLPGKLLHREVHRNACRWWVASKGLCDQHLPYHILLSSFVPDEHDAYDYTHSGIFLNSSLLQLQLIFIGFEFCWLFVYPLLQFFIRYFFATVSKHFSIYFHQFTIPRKHFNSAGFITISRRF